jgi:homocysteine S-methyltransferase
MCELRDNPTLSLTRKSQHLQPRPSLTIYFNNFLRMANTQAQILLLDGGLGTTLTDQFACIFDDSTPLWSSQLLLTSPSTLLAAQAAFAQAGADIILTATYQAYAKGFLASGVSQDEAEEAMRAAVRIARSSFNGSPGKVALSLGAYGAVMIPSQEYSGKYDKWHDHYSGLFAWHQNRAEVFSDHQDTWDEVDLVAFETLPLRIEIEAVRATMGVIGSKSGEKDFWISCVFPGEGNCLPDGSSVGEVVKAMLCEKENWSVPMGVGINCTKVGKLEGLIEEFEKEVGILVDTREVSKWPSLVVYPDGTNGEVYNTTTKEWEKKEEGVNKVSI